MNRKKYLECVEHGVTVQYNGVDYLPSAYKLTRKDGKWWHQAELLDMKSGRSLLIVALDKVE